MCEEVLPPHYHHYSIAMDNPSLLVPRAKNSILEIHGHTYKSNEVGKRHPFVKRGVSCKCPLVSPVCFQHVCFSSTKDDSLDQTLHKSFKTFPLLREKNLKINAMQRQGEDFLSLEDLDGEDDVEIVPEIYDKEAREVVRRHREALALQLAMEDSMQGIGQEKVEISETGELTDAKVPDHLLPKVAIVGRPNVGKSALFNRIAGGNTAIVNDEPGVTRDRLYARAYWGAREFMLIDTGGVVTIPSSGVAGSDGIAVTSGGGADALQRASREAIAAGLPSMIERQAAEAVKEASVMILVVDGQIGLSPVDVDIANWLRKKHSDKKLILAVNKCESPKKGLMQTMDFYSLGFEPMAVSAISGKGTGELLDCVCNGLKAAQVTDQSLDSDDRIPAIAIIGRPNVGKSSILNALAGEERTIVSPISGTTRDAIDTVITVPDGKSIKLIDTAGIRRRGRVAATGSKTESLSVNRAFRAIRRSDTVALVIDAMACVTEQDFKLGERIEKEGKGCVIIVNKWDTVPEKDGKTINHYEKDVREKLRILNWAPIVYTSATSGLRVQRILQTALEVEKESSRRLTTATLNQVLQEAVALKQPPRTRGGKKGRIYYCTQAAIRPPTFVFFVNDAKLFPDMYKRYMEKQLRANIGFQGTPIRLLWRSKKKSEKPKSLSTKGAAARS